MTDRIKALEDITDPDFIWGALDNVHDGDVSLDDYAAAVSRAQRAALAASQPAPDYAETSDTKANGLVLAAIQPATEPWGWHLRDLTAPLDKLGAVARAEAAEARVAELEAALAEAKEALIGVFADFDEALANCGSHIPPEIRTVSSAQPLTVQDAARVPEIAALIRARRHHVETVKTYNAKLKSVEIRRLNNDWSQDVAIEFFEMNEAHRDFIAAAQTAADAALRAIAEGRA